MDSDAINDLIDQNLQDFIVVESGDNNNCQSRNTPSLLHNTTTIDYITNNDYNNTTNVDGENYL